jgi:hypothetical protein
MSKELISYRPLLVSGSGLSHVRPVFRLKLEIGRPRNNELTSIESVQRLDECKGPRAFDGEP